MNGKKQANKTQYTCKASRQTTLGHSQTGPDKIVSHNKYRAQESQQNTPGTRYL